MVTIDKQGAHHASNGEYTNKPGASAGYDLGEEKSLRIGLHLEHPNDIRYIFDGTLGFDEDYEPPILPDDLRRRNKVASDDDPYFHFSDEELELAEILKQRGVSLISVNDVKNKFRSADGITLNLIVEETVELKNTTTGNPQTVTDRLAEGAFQSRNIVYYNKGSLTEDNAKIALSNILTDLGSHLNTIIIMLKDGHCIFGKMRIKYTKDKDYDKQQLE